MDRPYSSIPSRSRSLTYLILNIQILNHWLWLIRKVLPPQPSRDTSTVPPQHLVVSFLHLKRAPSVLFCSSQNNTIARNRAPFRVFFQITLFNRTGLRTSL